MSRPTPILGAIVMIVLWIGSLIAFLFERDFGTLVVTLLISTLVGALIAVVTIEDY